MSSPPPIALWLHRLLDPLSGTGLGRYVAEMAVGLTRLANPLPYQVRALDDDRPAWVDDVELVPIRKARRPLHLRWTLGVGPRLETITGPCSLVHSLYPSFPCPTASPLVATVHDLFPIERPDWYRTRERAGARRALHQIADDAVAVVTVSHWSADRVHEILGIERSRLHPIHLGVSSSFATLSPTDGSASAGHLLAVGHVGPRKNLGVVIEALSRFSDRRLLSVGPVDREEASRLQKLAESLGVDDRFIMEGPVSDRRLREALAGASALVHPSLLEGFGFTPLEAMVAGVPALVSRSGSLPEICRDGAVQLDPTDPDDWAAAIERVLADPDYRSDLVERGKRVAAGYPWDRTVAETASVHASVLRTRH